MPEEVINKNGNVIEKHFVVDKDFKDPLDEDNSFEELEVEEFKYYYQIHLGVPINQEHGEE